MTTFRVTVPLVVEAPDADEARRKAYEAITGDMHLPDPTTVPVLLLIGVGALVEEIEVR